MYCLSSVSGGALSYIHNMAPLLNDLFKNSQHGYRLTFLAHREQRDLFSSIDESHIIWITGKHLKGYRRIVWECKNMAPIAIQRNADILFTPYQIGPRVVGRKQILMLRNMEPFLCSSYSYSLNSRIRNSLLKQASLRSLRKADRVIAVSDFARHHLIHRIGINSDLICMIHHGQNTRFIPNGDDEKDQELINGLGIRSEFILTCGSLLPYRRCEDVIAAFNQSVNRLPADVQLVIAGAGTDGRYGDLIRQTIVASPYRDRILAVGYVPWEDNGSTLSPLSPLRDCIGNRGVSKYCN